MRFNRKAIFLARACCSVAPAIVIWNAKSHHPSSILVQRLAAHGRPAHQNVAGNPSSSRALSALAVSNEIFLLFFKHAGCCQMAINTSKWRHYYEIINRKELMHLIHELMK